MTNPGWEQLRSDLLLEHPRLAVHEDIARMPSGDETRYALLHLPDAVTVVIHDEQGNVLLNHEYAYPVDDRVHRPDNVTCDGWLYKFPGGGLEKDDADYAAAAVREVEEETGFRVSGVRLLAAVRNYFPRSNSIDYKVTAAIVEQGETRRSRAEANMYQVWLSRDAVEALIKNRDPRVMHSHFLDTWHLYTNGGF